MKSIVTSSQMKQLDQDTIEKKGVPSLVLMERAALSVVEELKQAYDLEHLLVVCGSGNNGADGMAIARILSLQGYRVSVFLAGKPESFTQEAKIQWEILENYSIPIVNKCYYNEYTTIVDAIFGVGLSREVSGKYAQIIQEINESKVPVAAVDIPSGIHGTTGQVMGIAVQATSTITFAYGKSGLYLYPGAFYAGKVTVKDIGIYGNPESVIYALDDKEWSWLPKRRPDGNKGSFGKVLVIAGSREMCGAAYLSAKACLLTGTGMVKIFTEETNRIPLQQLLPEALITTYKESMEKLELEALLDQALKWSDTILVGPGLGTAQSSHWIVENLLKKEHQRSMIFDADALNILSQKRERLAGITQSLVLTPHLGEMSRISGYSIAELKQNPVECLMNFQRTFDISQTIIMKDARTLTLTTDETCYINLTGNSGMATAGSGDVLAGMVTGFIAQGMEPSKAAPFGVWLHGIAGDYILQKKGVRSLLASDLLEAIPYLLKEK